MSKIDESGKSVQSPIGGPIGLDADQSSGTASEAKQVAAERAKVRTRRSRGESERPALHGQAGEGAVQTASDGQGAAATNLQKKPSKQEMVLELLRREDGATIDELIDATSWQAHSVRGILSGTVRKKLKLNLVSDVVGNGVRWYRVTASGGNDAAPEADQALPSSPPSEHPVTDVASSELAG
jgi:hypothetical protein